MTRPPPRRPPGPSPAAHLTEHGPAESQLITLQLHEAQLRGILASASEGIVTTDASQTIVMVNLAAARMFRCAVEELIGQPVEHLLPEHVRAHHHEAIAAFGAAESPARRMRGRGELTALRTDGEEFPIEAGISQAHVDGQRLFTVILRDLSAERHAAAELDRSERLLAATFNVSNVGIVHLDSSTHRLVAVNPAFCRLSGYDETELIGRSPEDLNLPTEPFDHDRFAALVRGDEDGRTERRLVRRDGSVVWVELSGSVVSDAAGRPSRVVAVVQDVTARRQAEAALRAREARLAFLVRLNDRLRPLDDAAQISLAASRLLGEFLDADRVGYAEDTGDGETMDVVRHHTRGVPGIEGRHRYVDYGTAMLSAFQDGRTVVRPDVANDPALSAEEKAAHAALQLGATVNVPLHKAGRLAAVFFVHRRQAHAWTADEVWLIEEVAERIRADIERARAEAAQRADRAQLESALDSMSDAFYIGDRDSNLLECNEAFAHFHRMPSIRACPRTLAQWRDILEVRNPDGTLVPESNWPVPRALRGETGSNVQLTLRRTDTGAQWPASYSFSPIRSPEGTVVGAVVSARDITEFRRMHDELATAHAELQQLIAAQDRVQEQERLRIARELHDDLQQRLAAIGMEAASVQAASRSADPAVRAALERIERIALQTIDSARRIIEDLRPEALETLGVPAALERLAERFGERTGMDTRLDTEALDPADLRRLVPLGTCLYRVTQEALTNVARHAQARHARITLASVPGERLRLSVTDDGIGLPDDQAADRRRFGLLGMRERVRAAGGTLRVHGQAGQGTRIEAELPLPAAEPGAPDGHPPHD